MVADPPGRLRGEASGNMPMTHIMAVDRTPRKSQHVNPRVSLALSVNMA